MAEIKNNPAIFNRAKHTSDNNKICGVAALQKGIAGNGDKITSEQLTSFHNELRLRKFAKIFTILSIPAAVFFLKKNPSLALASSVFSFWFSNVVYSSCLLNSRASLTKEMVKESEDNFRRRILRANQRIVTSVTEENRSVKYFTRREYNELYKYR